MHFFRLNIFDRKIWLIGERILIEIFRKLHYFSFGFEDLLLRLKKTLIIKIYLKAIKSNGDIKHILI